ncbi:MAG: flagellar hook-length control protein FliK [Bacillota bacterium]
MQAFSAMQLSNQPTKMAKQVKDVSKSSSNQESFLSQLEQLENKNHNQTAINDFSSQKLNETKLSELDIDLDQTELKKLKEALTTEDGKLSIENLAEFLSAVVNLNQQLNKLDLDQLSSADQKQFVKLVEKLSATLDDITDQLSATESKLTDLTDLKEELTAETETKLEDELAALISKQDNNLLESLQQNDKSSSSTADDSKLFQQLVKLKELTTKLQKLRAENKLPLQAESDQIKKLFSKLELVDKELTTLLQQNNSSLEGNEESLAKLKGDHLLNDQHSSTTDHSTSVRLDNSREKMSQQNFKEFDSEQRGNQFQKNSDQQLLKKLLKLEDEGAQSTPKFNFGSSKQAQKDKLSRARLNLEGQLQLKNQISQQQFNEFKTITMNGKSRQINQTEVINQVLEQLDQLKSLGKRELSVQLKPDFLGKLDLKMAVEDGLVSTKIVAENYQVKKLIESQLPQLRDSLTAKNLEIGELIVDVESQENSTNLQQNSSNQHQFSQQQESNSGVDEELLAELGIVDEPLEVKEMIESTLGVETVDYII